MSPGTLDEGPAVADTDLPTVARTLTEGAVRRAVGQKMDPEKRDERRRRAAERALAARKRGEADAAKARSAQSADEPSEEEEDRGKLVDVRV